MLLCASFHYRTKNTSATFPICSSPQSVSITKTAALAKASDSLLKAVSFQLPLPLCCALTLQREENIEKGKKREKEQHTPAIPDCIVPSTVRCPQIISYCPRKCPETGITDSNSQRISKPARATMRPSTSKTLVSQL